MHKVINTKLESEQTTDEQIGSSTEQFYANKKMHEYNKSEKRQQCVQFLIE